MHSGGPGPEGVQAGALQRCERDAPAALGQLRASLGCVGLAWVCVGGWWLGVGSATWTLIWRCYVRLLRSRLGLAGGGGVQYGRMSFGACPDKIY